MFAPSIQVESISFFEQGEGVWREENVKSPTGHEAKSYQEDEEEDFLAFCRRSLM
jgi:hypothetical protein